MARYKLSIRKILMIAFLLVWSGTLAAQVDQLVPSTAKGFIAVPDVTRLDASWNRTQVAALFNSESVQQFVESLEQQLTRRYATTGRRVGLELNDLQEVCTGEVAMAFMQPDDEVQPHAMAAIARVEGNDKGVDELLESIAKNMAQREATASKKEILGIRATVYEVPTKRRAKKSFNAIIMHHDGWLVATDHIETAKQIAKNLNAPGTDALANVEAYKECMKRCAAGANGVEPEIRWFIEPLGYAELAREFALQQRRRRTDILAAIKKQGFTAVQGIGGFATLAPSDYEALGNAYVYAPAVAGAANKYPKAAALMSYPVLGDLDAEKWVPTEAGSYVSARWGIREAYQHVGSLVDEVAGEPGFWKDLVNSLKKDPNGPRIDLEKEIVAHLGERVSIYTSTKKPIDISSERFLIAIELSDADGMTKGIEKALKDDPDAEPVEYKEHVIWKIISDIEDEFDMELGGLGDDGFGQGFDEEEEGEPLLSNAAISIVKGYLVVSSHVELVQEMIDVEPSQDILGDDQDHLAVKKALKKIGDGETTSGRVIARIDREIEASYELLRTGKMENSEGLIGRIIAKILGTNDDVSEFAKGLDVERMPTFDEIRGFFGTAGLFIRTEDDGWYIGVLALPPNEQGEGQLGNRAALSTAANEETVTIEN